MLNERPAECSTRFLVLWDIDHTLVENGGVCREAMAAAFKAVTGKVLEMGMLDSAGRTDAQTIDEILAFYGVRPANVVSARVVAALADAFAANAELLHSRGAALDGAEAALRAVGSLPGVVQSVVTGNIQPIAVMKLAAFGLDRYLECDVGAYGSESRSRPKLVRLALDRAVLKHGHALEGGATIVIGDTPRDIDAAHANGAPVIAVATGGSTMDELHAHGADIVLPGLQNTAAVVNAVLRVQRSGQRANSSARAKR